MLNLVNSALTNTEEPPPQSLYPPLPSPNPHILQKKSYRFLLMSDLASLGPKWSSSTTLPFFTHSETNYIIEFLLLPTSMHMRDTLELAM
jgi:hypothetical protein